jgi:solute carrier family 25 (mitochondrial carnitine/acylcarnitine transporter), member 20/29
LQAFVAIMNGITFALYQFFKKIQLADADAIPTLAQVTLAGAATGMTTAYGNLSCPASRFRS